MYSLARKNNLGKSLMKLWKQFPTEYNYFPKTWLLPTEMSDFRNQFNYNNNYNKDQKKKKVKTYIVKPEALS